MVLWGVSKGSELGAHTYYIGEHRFYFGVSV